MITVVVVGTIAPASNVWIAIIIVLIITKIPIRIICASLWQQELQENTIGRVNEQFGIISSDSGELLWPSCTRALLPSDISINSRSIPTLRALPLASQFLCGRSLVRLLTFGSIGEKTRLIQHL